MKRKKEKKEGKPIPPWMMTKKKKGEKSSINQYLILWVRLDTVYLAEN